LALVILITFNVASQEEKRISLLQSSKAIGN
jgi:hypothetical protein